MLANDTDPDGDALIVDQLNGSGVLSGTSAKGAAVTLNGDGSFSYDPTGSATLQAVPRGQTTTDTFTYRANDGHGATATATVTVTVVGVNHPPIATSDSYAVNNDTVLSQSAPGVLANDTDADGDMLVVDQLNGTGVCRSVYRHQRQGRGCHTERRWLVQLRPDRCCGVASSAALRSARRRPTPSRMKRPMGTGERRPPPSRSR